MDLDSYLDRLMEDRHIKNVTLAEATGLSPSYISKIRSGSRKPPLGGEIFEKIYRGLASLAEEGEKEGAAWDLPPSYEAFLQLFLPEDGSVEKMPWRLNSLMEVFSVQNKTLARHLNCDPSLVSKFRTGNRLAKQEDYILGIADFFALQVLESPKPEELRKKLQAGLGLTLPPDRNHQDLKKAFWQYLCRDKREKDFFDRMFTMLNGVSPGRPDLSKLSAVLQRASLPATPTIRRQGYRGLRKLVLNFLSLVVNAEEPLELKLFSNHDMRWMTEDPEFFDLWKFLMIAVLNKGHKVQILHNLLRSDEEMYAAIEGWTPLHLYGNLDSSVFESQPDPTFSHTLFICRDHFAITGHSIRGLEDETDFYFSQDPALLASIEAGYNSLATRSKPLMKAAHFLEDSLALEALLDLYSRPFAGRFYSLQKNLPIWTIDRSLLESILRDNALSDHDRDQILSYVDRVRQIFMDRIRDNDIYECFYLPDKFESEEMTLDLIHGKREGVVSYRPQEYLQHLASIQKLARTYPRYHPLLLKEPAFSNLKIIKTGEGGINVVNLLPPLSIICYNNDRLDHNFRGYMEEKLLPLMREEGDLDTFLNQFPAKPL